MADDRLDKIINALMDYDDKRIVHLYGAVRELHRHRQPDREDIIRLMDFVYSDKKTLN